MFKFTAFLVARPAVITVGTVFRWLTDLSNNLKSPPSMLCSALLRDGCEMGVIFRVIDSLDESREGGTMSHVGMSSIHNVCTH